MRLKYGNYLLGCSQRLATVGGCIFLCLTVLVGGNASADGTSYNFYNIKPEEVIASVRPARARNRDFENLEGKVRRDMNGLATELVSVLDDTALPNFDRCAAAYYLGLMRVSSAADTLANKIDLLRDPLWVGDRSSPVHEDNHLPLMSGYVAAEALIKIGNPSIAPVIRNLEESDDPKVRELSLEVLYRIDGDKDVVQLRLQKAERAKRDPKKIERLQAAQRAFAGMTTFSNLNPVVRLSP